MSLKPFYEQGHEIIIIDDGSNDGSKKILSDCNFIKLIKYITNQGKGVAIRKGLTKASHKAIVIFDGDLELDPFDIKKLMILDRSKNIECAFGTRFKKSMPVSNTWDFGNFILTKIFNIVNNSQLVDSLCCAKSFFISSIDSNRLKSEKFDIDIEIAKNLLKNCKNIKEVNLNYKRRTPHNGKKLRLRDGFSVFKRIFY